jgi:hypothetical protein
VLVREKILNDNNIYIYIYILLFLQLELIFFYNSTESKVFWRFAALTPFFFWLEIFRLHFVPVVNKNTSSKKGGVIPGGATLYFDVELLGIQ